MIIVSNVCKIRNGIKDDAELQFWIDLCDDILTGDAILTLKAVILHLLFKCNFDPLANNDLAF